jgi:hypothetical protein
MPIRRGSVLQASTSRRASEIRQAFALLNAEDGADDHLERDALHRRPGGEGHTARPALDLTGGDVCHDLLVAAKACAVKGGEHQPALRHVLALVE